MSSLLPCVIPLKLICSTHPSMIQHAYPYKIAMDVGAYFQQAPTTLALFNTNDQRFLGSQSLQVIPNDPSSFPLCSSRCFTYSIIEN